MLIRIGLERSLLERVGLPDCLTLFDREASRSQPAGWTPGRTKTSGEMAASGRVKTIGEMAAPGWVSATKNSKQGFWKKHKEKKRLQAFAKEQEGERQQILQALDHVWQLIAPLIDFPSESCLVYEEALKRKAFPELWNKYCALPEFDAYMQDRWAELLFPNIRHADLLVLGYSFSLLTCLRQRGARIKSLKWLLPKQFYREDMKQFEEDFYYEFGLVMDLQVLSGEQEYRRIPIRSKKPVTVIDFSGEDKLFVGELAPGSIWIDMASLDEKQRRIEGLLGSISYISLKKKWKQAKKDSFFLDTNSKNGYNT